MSFSIAFVDHTELAGSAEPMEGFRIGRIVIGEFEEWFESPLLYWSIDDYRAHWKRALERIVAGAAKSALFTSMYEPRHTNWLLCWPLYRQEETVYIQNHMFFMEGIAGDFDPMNPYLHVRDRETVNGEGRKVSEWRTTVKGIREFLQTWPLA